MKIAIELNNIVRDINSQFLKYYQKDIDKNFDGEKLNKHTLHFIDSLPFKSKKEKNEFIYVDYPYEIFGCASTMHRQLAVMINNWIYELSNLEDDTYSLSFFSLIEEGLSIQSTYFFLSKIGSRVREMFFPKDGKTMWLNADVIITTNERIVKTKPKGKVVVTIRLDDNDKTNSKADLVYESLMDIITDEDFFTKVRKIQKQNQLSFWQKIKNKLKL